MLRVYFRFFLSDFQGNWLIKKNIICPVYIIKYSKKLGEYKSKYWINHAILFFKYYKKYTRSKVLSTQKRPEYHKPGTTHPSA